VHDSQKKSPFLKTKKVRLFLPEFNGYVSASSNRDKGETLDAMPDEVNQGLATRKRWGASRPHCAYLKPLQGLDPSAPANLSAKVRENSEYMRELCVRRLGVEWPAASGISARSLLIKNCRTIKFLQ
jgi:hypothetical protein